MKETVSNPGQNLERGLSCAFQGSERAGHGKRLLFLARGSVELAGVKEWWLPKVSFGHETDKILRHKSPIDGESAENDCPF